MYQTLLSHPVPHQNCNPSTATQNSSTDFKQTRDFEDSGGKEGCQLPEKAPNESAETNTVRLPPQATLPGCMPWIVGVAALLVSNLHPPRAVQPACRVWCYLRPFEAEDSVKRGVPNLIVASLPTTTDDDWAPCSVLMAALGVRETATLPRKAFWPPLMMCMYFGYDLAR